MLILIDKQQDMSFLEIVMTQFIKKGASFILLMFVIITSHERKTICFTRLNAFNEL